MTVSEPDPKATFTHSFLSVLCDRTVLGAGRGKTQWIWRDLKDVGSRKLSVVAET